MEDGYIKVFFAVRHRRSRAGLTLVCKNWRKTNLL